MKRVAKNQLPLFEMVGLDIAFVARWRESATSADQNKLLMDYIVKNEARAINYSMARSKIRTFHQERQSLAWLAQSATELEVMALHAPTETTKKLYGCNAKGIRDYLKKYKEPHGKWNPCQLRPLHIHSQVAVRVAPDYIREHRGSLEIVRLEFPRRYSYEYFRTLHEVMFLAASNTPWLLGRPHRVSCLHVPSWRPMPRGYDPGMEALSDLYAIGRTIFQRWIIFKKKSN